MCTRSIWKENFQTCLGMNWWIFTHNYQFSLVTQSCPTPCDPMDCNTPGFPVHHQLLQLAQTHVHQSVMPTNHLIFCCPLLLPSIFPSIRVFSSESVLCIMWPKYWSFSMNPSNERSGLISFRNEWFDLLTVQGTLNSLFQHLKGLSSVFSNTSVWKDQFFGIQPSLWSSSHIHTWLLGKP